MGTNVQGYTGFNNWVNNQTSYEDKKSELAKRQADILKAISQEQGLSQKDAIENHKEEIEKWNADYEAYLNSKPSEEYNVLSNLYETMETEKANYARLNYQEGSGNQYMFDMDKDGKLSDEEAFLKSIENKDVLGLETETDENGLPTGKMKIAEIKNEFDTNNDGIADFDTNGDGYLTLQEYKNYLIKQEHQTIAKGEIEAKGGNDDKISAEEYIKKAIEDELEIRRNAGNEENLTEEELQKIVDGTYALFNSIDSNNDYELTLDELSNFYRQMDSYKNKKATDVADGKYSIDDVVSFTQKRQASGLNNATKEDKEKAIEAYENLVKEYCQ